jgi:hypothetical protein
MEIAKLLNSVSLEGWDKISLDKSASTFVLQADRF